MVGLFTPNYTSTSRQKKERKKANILDFSVEMVASFIPNCTRDFNLDFLIESMIISFYVADSG
jgi:hypothetical protein